MINFYGSDYDDIRKRKKPEFGGVERNRDLEKKQKKKDNKKINKEKNKENKNIQYNYNGEKYFK